jgi:hypothetical protein
VIGPALVGVLATLGILALFWGVCREPGDRPDWWGGMVGGAGGDGASLGHL